MVSGGGWDPRIYEALRACRLWRAASDEAVERLAAGARPRRFPAGAVVASEGDPADAFGVIVSGTAAVGHLGADGRRIAFESVGPGEPILAVAALARGRYPASVDASSALMVAWLSRDALFDLMAEEPTVARDIVTDLAERVVRFTGIVQSLSLDVPSRLARFLFQRALAAGRRSDEGIEVDLGMTKTALAEALATVPETLSRAFARLRDEKLVDTHGAKVVVLDFGGLARRGAGYEEG